MKVILIDVTAQTVTDFDLQPGVKAMYKAIGCQCVDRVELDINTDMWLDDEGLLHQPQPPKFKIGGYNSIFAGNALICGYNDEGETISTVHTAEQIKPMIEFLGFVLVKPVTYVTSW